MNPGASAAQDNPVNIYLFWAQDCPHCLQEKEFLAKLAQQDPGVKIILLEIADRENLALLQKVGAALKTEAAGVPFTVVSNRHLVGWLDEASTGRAIIEAVRQTRQEGLPDLVARVRAATPLAPELPGPAPKAIPEKLRLPWVGDLDTRHLSLGLLTLVIGVLDGFNPCAMWVLVFLINLLLGMEDRKKMWVLGASFIAASSAVYFLFMTAWLNLLVFVGFIVWVRLGIGLAALVAGGYNLREYWTNRAGVCKLSNTPERQKRMARLQEIIQTRKFWLALGGILILAFAVNLVELICSAGFPVVYLQVLSLTPLPSWQYYLYLLLYIVVFMLDDLVVFIAAMVTLQLVGLGAGYKRASNLVGGVLMLLLGVLLIFKPQALMFG